MKDIEKTMSMDGSDRKRWFVCDPALNRECGKKSCFLYGGPCDLTSKAECAVKDPDGEPVEVDPRERLQEMMRARKAGTGPVCGMITL